MEKFWGEVIQCLRSSFVIESSGTWEDINLELAREMCNGIDVYQKLIEAAVGDGEHPLAHAIINASEFGEESQLTGVKTIPDKWLRAEEYRAEEARRWLLSVAKREKEEEADECRKESVRRVMHARIRGETLSYADVAMAMNSIANKPCSLSKASVARAYKNYAEEISYELEFYEEYDECDLGEFGVG